MGILSPGPRPFSIWYTYDILQRNESGNPIILLLVLLPPLLQVLSVVMVVAILAVVIGGIQRC